MSILKEAGARVRDAFDQHVRGHAAETIKMRQIHRKVSSAISEDMQLYAEKVFAEKVELLEFLKTAAFEHFIYETIALAYSGTLTTKRLEATPAYQDLKRLKEIIDDTETRFVTEMIARYQKLANNHELLLKMHMRVLIGRSVRKGEAVKTEKGEIQHVGKVLGFMRSYREELAEMSTALSTLIKALHPVKLKKGCEALAHSGVAAEVRTATQRFLGNRRTMYGIQDFNDLQEVKDKVFGQARDSLMQYVHKQEQTLVEAIKSPEHSQTINNAFPEIRRLTTLLEKNATEQRALIKRTEKVLGDLFDIEVSLLSAKQKADLRKMGAMRRFARSGYGRFAMASVTATIAVGAVSNIAYAQEADRPAVVEQVRDERAITTAIEDVTQRITQDANHLRTRTEHIFKQVMAARNNAERKAALIDFAYFNNTKFLVFEFLKIIRGTNPSNIDEQIEHMGRTLDFQLKRFMTIQEQGDSVFRDTDLRTLRREITPWIQTLKTSLGERPEPPAHPAGPGVDDDHDGATDEADRDGNEPPVRPLVRPDDGAESLPPVLPPLEPDTMKTPREIIAEIIDLANHKIPVADIHISDYRDVLGEMGRGREVQNFEIKSKRIKIMLTQYAYLAQGAENTDYPDDVRRAIRIKADQIYASAHDTMERIGLALFHEGLRTSDAIDAGIRTHESFTKYLKALETEAIQEQAEAEQQEIIIHAQRTFTEAERDGDLSKLNSAVSQLGSQISTLQVMGEELERSQGDSYDPSYIEGRQQPFRDALAPMQIRLDKINELRGIFSLKDIIGNEATLRFIVPDADLPVIAKEMPQDQAKILIEKYMVLHQELESDSTNANRYFTRHFHLFEEVVRYQAAEGHKRVEEARTAFGQSQEPDARNPEELSDKALVALEYAGIFLKALEPSESLMEEHRRLKAEIDGIESQIHSQAVDRLYQEATTEYTANEYGDAVDSYLDYFKSLPKSGEAAAQSDKIQTAKTNILEAITHMDMGELKEALHGTEGSPGFKALTTAMHETGAEGTTPELKATLREISDALTAKITELGGNPDTHGDFDPDIIIGNSQRDFESAEREGNLPLLRDIDSRLIGFMHAIEEGSSTLPEDQREIARQVIEKIDAEHDRVRERLRAILQIEVACQVSRLLPADQLDEFNMDAPNHGKIIDHLDLVKAIQFAKSYIRLNEKLAEDESARTYFSKHKELFGELVNQHYLNTIHYLEEARRLYIEAGDSDDEDEATEKRSQAKAHIETAGNSVSIVATGKGILSLDYEELSDKYKETQRMERHGVEREDGGFTIRGVQDKEVIIIDDAEWGEHHIKIHSVRQDPNGVVFVTIDADKTYHIFYAATGEDPSELIEASKVVETTKGCCFRTIDNHTAFTFTDTEGKERVYYDGGVTLGYDDVFLIGAKVLEDKLLFGAVVEGERHIIYGDSILPRTDRAGQEMGRSLSVSGASIEDDEGTRILKVKIGRTTYEFEL